MPVSTDVLLTHSEKERALMDAKFIARPCLPLSMFSVRLRAWGERTTEGEKVRERVVGMLGLIHLYTECSMSLDKSYGLAGKM